MISYVIFTDHRTVGLSSQKTVKNQNLRFYFKPRPTMNAFWKGLDESFQMKPLPTKSAVSESSLKACFYFSILQDAWFFVNICTIKPVNGRFRENVVLF